MRLYDQRAPATIASIVIASTLRNPSDGLQDIHLHDVVVQLAIVLMDIARLV